MMITDAPPKEATTDTHLLEVMTHNESLHKQVLILTQIGSKWPSDITTSGKNIDERRLTLLWLNLLEMGHHMHGT